MTAEEARAILLPGTEVQVELTHNPIYYLWARVDHVSEDEVLVQFCDPSLEYGTKVWFRIDEINLLDDD